MSTNTSIGPDAARGGNDNPGNADGCGNKTLGTHGTQQPPTAADGEQLPVPDAREPEAARGQPTTDR